VHTHQRLASTWVDRINLPAVVVVVVAMEVEVVGVTEVEVVTEAGMEVVVDTVVADTDHDVPDPDQDLDHPTTEIDIKETNTQRTADSLKRWL